MGASRNYFLIIEMLFCARLVLLLLSKALSIIVHGMKSFFSALCLSRIFTKRFFSPFTQIMICCDCFWHGFQLGCLFTEMIFVLMAAKRDVDDDETIKCGVSRKVFPRKILSPNGGMNIKMSVHASGCEVKLLKLREEPRKCPSVIDLACAVNE